MAHPEVLGADDADVAQIEEVVRLAAEVLFPSVLGVYLHGSAVLGGLRPHSDLDLLVVVAEPTSQDQRRALVDGLLEVSGSRARRGPARPVELTAVMQREVRPWRFPPRCEFQYGEWLRAEYERGDTPAPGPSPDLALLVAATLGGGAALAGPPPHQLLDPVPHEDMVRAMVAGVPSLLGDLESDTANVVLTLARILLTLETGSIGAKDTAVDWVLSRLPVEHRPVLSRARAVYLGEAPDQWDDLLAAVPACAAHVRSEINRLCAVNQR
jgi:streptomycin 3"-adenylyltransferase